MFVLFLFAAMLMYRTCRCCRRIWSKLLHTTFHLLAAPCIAIAFVAVYVRFHHIFLRILNFLFLSYVHPILRFWFLVSFSNKVMKIRKYYVIFVYILQGKMGKVEKNHPTKVTKIPKAKRRKYG